MIETDLSRGYLNGKGEARVIMAHPPLTESDLSLEDFIATVLRVRE